MKRLYLFVLLALFSFSTSFAQTTADYAVQLTATVQVTPPKVNLTWVRHADTPTYYIYKKAKNAGSWGAAIATLPYTDSTYTDLAVVADSNYEYQVLANGNLASGSGYLFAGIKSPPLHNKGAIILLVDSTFTDSCAPELHRLRNDLRADGWEVIRRDLSRTMPDTAVHAIIKNLYNANPRLRAVLIVGHIAVPYSGDINPDGHPDHLGAWPADVYYGNMDGVWTDATVNDISAGYPANQNIPGDGKWDLDMLPTNNKLQVSRIDFSNMPAFPKSEIELMRSYLKRDHVYKMDSLNIAHRALISDNFGPFSGEAFAASGFRNFAPLVGTDSVKIIPYISSMNAESYQWSYGCGGGSFTSAGGIGVTNDFVTNNINGIFTMLFGSYFGDWNVTNNFLRAPLCSDTPALTICWSGRPQWMFHHMAMGENIGYSALLSQNNTNLYLSQNLNYGAKWVHEALLGDLTLRSDYIKPPSNLAISAPLNAGATLTWTASPDAGVLGYYVYRSTTPYGSYQKISSLIPTTTYVDTVGTNGLQYYLVRPSKLDTTPSGTYYNLGLGIVDSANVTYPIPVNVAELAANSRISLYPNPVKNNMELVVDYTKNTAATFYIMNMEGQVVREYTKQLSTGRNTFSFDVSKLPSGVYSLTMNADGYRETKNWIKVN